MVNVDVRKPRSAPHEPDRLHQPGVCPLLRRCGSRSDLDDVSAFQRFNVSAF
jgi:hypothetical protein